MSKDLSFIFSGLLNNVPGTENFSSDELEKATADFKGEEIRTKTINNKTTSYITESALINRLNEVYGGAWSFFTTDEVILNPDEKARQIIRVTGWFIVNVPGRPPRIFNQYGTAAVIVLRENNTTKDIGQDFKIAATNAFRRCAQKALGQTREDINEAASKSGTASTSNKSNAQTQTTVKPKDPSAPATDRQKDMLTGWLGKAVHFPVEDYNLEKMAQGEISELIAKCMRLKEANETWDSIPNTTKNQEVSTKEDTAPANVGKPTPVKESGNSENPQKAAAERIKAELLAKKKQESVSKVVEEVVSPVEMETTELQEESVPVSKSVNNSGNNQDLAELYEAAARIIGVADDETPFDYDLLDEDDRDCVDATISSIYGTISKSPMPPHEELDVNTIKTMIGKIQDIDGVD